RKLQMLFFIFLVSMCTNSQIFAQNSTKSIEQIISGTTKDEKGDILPGVNVILKGTQIGVNSDADGKYSIAANTKDASLIYSFIGYLTEEVKINDQSSIINVALQPESNSLNEVVVIGYGTQKN